MKSEGFTAIFHRHINNKWNTSRHKSGKQQFDFHSEYIYALC